MNWSKIQENGRKEIVFDGNTDDTHNAFVTNNLSIPINPRFVRLNVVEWNGNRPGLRWAIDRCPDV